MRDSLLEAGPVCVDEPELFWRHAARRGVRCALPDLASRLLPFALPLLASCRTSVYRMPAAATATGCGRSDAALLLLY